MTLLRILSLVLAVLWSVAALAFHRRTWRLQAGWALLVAGGHVLAALRPDAAPLMLAAWLGYGLAVPSGRLGASRRVLLAVGGFCLAGWALLLALGDTVPPTGLFPTVALLVTAISAVAIVRRCQHGSAADRAAVQWLSAASVTALAADVVLLGLRVMAGTPVPLRFWLALPLVLVPLSQVCIALVKDARVAEIAVVEAIVVAGLSCLVVGLYLLIVVALGHWPAGSERGILVACLIAALVVAAIAQPARLRLAELAAGLVDRSEGGAEQVVATIGARMSRAVPMDELMLQLTESLRATIATGGAEIWVGVDGVLDRSVSVPSRSPRRLSLGDRERVVIGRARIGGHSWASVWLPEIAAEPLAAAFGNTDGQGDLRIAPVAHLGDLLGLIIVRRLPGAAALTDDDDRLLVELARQLGLALHNVQLDSALQQSLKELEQRNMELKASRLRIVTAADASRQMIERNLHDGAQQHLVALAVKLGMAEQVLPNDPDVVGGLLSELRHDVQETIGELRELAHGIYPPLLRDLGLAEALRAAANRSPLACTVDVDLPGRYPQEVETASYFCCLEAMQNAGKHAGRGATLVVRVGLADGGRHLHFQVHDDGAGFESTTTGGHGFVNMADRLGAIGGQLDIMSTVGEGTTVSGTIPVSVAVEPGPDFMAHT